MIADPAGRAAFIRAQTRVAPVPLRPDIRLHLADEVMPLWQMTEAERGGLELPPPFWAFAWAGGQALAAYLAATPDLVRGRRVLDFASGSGLVAIAAVKAGAALVEAVDIDPMAEAAIRLNADENDVAIATRTADLVGTDEGWDVVLAGDIAYERDTAKRVTDWLEALSVAGRTVLVGDPGRAYLARDQLIQVAEYDVPVSRDLEGVEVRRGGVWRFTGALSRAPV